LPHLYRLCQERSMVYTITFQRKAGGPPFVETVESADPPSIDRVLTFLKEHGYDIMDGTAPDVACDPNEDADEMRRHGIRVEKID